MSINLNKFKKNISFFIICIMLIVIFSLLSFLFDRKNNSLDKVDLNDKDININSLVINEIMTSNNGVITDEDAKLYDYLELYNGNDKDIVLKNYGLSDESGTVKWIFPEVTIKSKSYMIVFLSGTNSDGLHTNFKLKSAGGETLALLKPNGKVVDAVETIGLDSNTVMARDENGKWVIQNKPTPGYSNNVEGHTNFLKSLETTEEKDIAINEILPSNKGNFKNEFNEYSGYIEIKNISNSTVNLENYSLSNNEDVNFKWQFPNIKLSKGEVLLVYTNGVNNKVDTLSTSFKLNNKNGVVVLSNNKGKIIEKVKYENLPNGMAYIKENDKFFEGNSISPGYQNTTDGIKSFQKKYLENPKDIIINEAMNSNYSYLAQNGGNYYDWIELYNNTSKTINLKDYCLTTNTDTMCMYNLPDKELKKNEYYIIMASGNESLSNSSYKHTNFKLSDTESLYLTKSNEIIDSMYMANIPKGYSMGRGSSSGIYYFSKPTPKEKNSSGQQAVSYIPTSSVKSGIYNDKKSIKVALSGSGKIYYTTDGSTPTTSSNVYSSPLTIKKTTVLRTMSAQSGKINSEVNTYTYIMNENHKLPIISLAIDPKDLSNLHTHAWTEGYMKKVDVELLELDGSGFKISAGLKLFGGATRGHAKKSYELKFKKEFGDAKLEYKVFDNVDSSVFDSIVLRTGSQDEMGDASKKTLIRDIVGTSLVDEYTNVDVQAYKPVVMYLNGKYWGLYFIREKVDETFVANHYNVNATKENTDILRIDNQVKTGSTKKYNEMISFINNNSLSKSKNYDKIKDMIDIENLCDFWIAETWTANNDIVNTRFFSNPNIDNGKWKYIFYDLDFAFYNVNSNYYQFSTSPSGMTINGYSTVVLRNLMKNSEFKKTYLERLSYNLNNTWKTDNVLKKIDDVINEISESEIKRNLERWNLSYSEWKNNIEFLKDYAKKRNSYMVSQAKSYFGLSNSEVKKYFGDVK